MLWRFPFPWHQSAIACFAIQSHSRRSVVAPSWKRHKVASEASSITFFIINVWTLWIHGFHSSKKSSEQLIDGCRQIHLSLHIHQNESSHVFSTLHLVVDRILLGTGPSEKCSFLAYTHSVSASVLLGVNLFNNTCNSLLLMNESNFCLELVFCSVSNLGQYTLSSLINRDIKGWTSTLRSRASTNRTCYCSQSRLAIPLTVVKWYHGIGC